MQITTFKIGEVRTRSAGVSLELIDDDGRRVGLCYVDKPEMAPKLIAARRVVVEGGPR
jgi:hypothetical protein